MNNVSTTYIPQQQKIYIVENLDCANCAAKMERKIQDLPQVQNASLTFATKQLKITADHPDQLLPVMESICQSIEGQVRLVSKEAVQAKPAAVSAPGKKSFFRQNAADLLSIAAGAVLFAAGLILEHSLAEATAAWSILLFAIFAVSYVILGWCVLWTAARNISHGQVFDENFLMSIATIAAFCIGDFAEGVGVMLFYRIGEFFEHVAVEKSRAQIMDAVDMRPETVNLVIGGQGQPQGHHHEEEVCGCGCGHDHAEHDHEHEHKHKHDHDHEHEHGHPQEAHVHEHCDCGCEDDHGHSDHFLPAEQDHGHGHRHGQDEADIRVIPAGEAKPGDILLVRPGDRIPLDGIVTEGDSRIDTSPVTGEPVPVKAAPGTEVISGCVNVQGLLKIKVTKPLSESMVTRILDSVENAAAGKPKIDKFITKFAKVYTPIVVALAILTAIVPSLITGNWSFWITTAITFLVISCPCALVISVPLAFFSGIGAASRLGILFKGGLAIEALKKVKAIAMDKTGTITQGNFMVQQILPAGNFTEEQLLTLAAACEANSTHPIAASITEAAQQRALSMERPAAVEELSGMGIRAVLPQTDAEGETVVLCGNKKLLEHFGIDTAHLNTDADPAFSNQALQSSEKALAAGAADAATRVFLARDGQYAGMLTISDTIKSDAIAAVSSIKSAGLVPAMLTGDAGGSAQSVAAQTGIERIFAQLMPEEKLDALRQLRSEYGSVMFVGDGINDAPVLANADVGAAMGTGADAAIEAADVVFMNSSVAAIPQSISIAKATSSIAIQNVVFALVIKLLVILLGLVGFANIWAAIFADTGVAMLCILNSLRILWRKF